MTPKREVQMVGMCNRLVWHMKEIRIYNTGT